MKNVSWVEKVLTQSNLFVIVYLVDRELSFNS